MHSKISERFSLIPLAHAVPVLQAYLAAQQDDGSALAVDEREALARLTTLVIETSELLLRYAVAVGGRPMRN